MIGVCRADRQWSGQDHGRSGRRCDTQYLQRYRWVLSNRCWAGGCVLSLPSVRLPIRTGVGLPPYRGWPARPGPGFSGKAGGNAPGPAGPGPGDLYGLLGSCIVSHSGANHAAACNCFCVWLLRFGFCGGSSPLCPERTTQEPSPWGEGAPKGRMRGSLKVRARFRWRKRRRSFFRCVATALDVSTSSDLASLGHLPLKGKAFYALLRCNQQQLSPQNPVFINLTSMRRRLKGPAPQQNGCRAYRKQTAPPKRAPIKRGPGGNPLGVFRPLLRPKGDPQPGGCPSGEDTGRALP